VQQQLINDQVTKQKKDDFEKKIKEFDLLFHVMMYKLIVVELVLLE